MRLGLSTLAAAVLITAGAEADAQQNGDNGGRRTVPATRMADGESITLDGRFDEPVWARAITAGDFRQIEPDNGQPATEGTEIRILFDATALYLGVVAFDSEPGKLVRYQKRRDEFLQSDDKFQWTIDTFLDARTGYFFEMNASGAMADSLMGVNGGNRAWDGIWDARAYRHDKGWNLEIRLPFQTLSFNPARDTWGMNFQRTVSRKNEQSIWTGWLRNQGLQRMTNAGHVTGISNVTQGRGLELKPYGVYTASAAPGRGQTALDGDGGAGFDVFYSPTPVLRTTLTVNTDFAQTEVDQRQVNLTRFNLFFPEKRDFFLDGATFFDFGSPGAGGGAGGNRGGQGNDLLVNPFFSRRIGLSEAGSPQRIDVGTKITGQMGGQDVGVLYVRSGDDGDFIGEDFMVARVKRRMLTQSYVGVMYTGRNARLGSIVRPGLVDGTQHTSGLDMRLATNRFRGSDNLSGTFWFLNAARPEVTSGNNAFGAQLDYPNDVWQASLSLREVQENFDPGVGFVSRNAYRRYQPTLSWNPRPRGHRYIRQFGFGPDVDIQTDLEGRTLTRNVGLTPFEVNLHSQEQFAVELDWSHERLDRPFNISRGITLPAGAEYDFMRWSLRGSTANRRVVSVFMRYSGGDFYSGTRRQFMSTLNLRLRPGHMFYLTGEWNDVDLREGSFISNVYRVIGETQFSPFLFVVNNFQFDTVSRVAGWQSRFRWIMKPGNDLHLVYTHNWLEDPAIDRFASLDRRFASKILYTHRF